MTKIAELYGLPTVSDPPAGGWAAVAADAGCPFFEPKRKCLKTRKSQPDITIGSCTMTYGRAAAQVMICPFRLLERGQIFEDCKPLATLHEPGNEWHVVPELDLPGGSVDYCLASVRKRKVIDFVGIELQTLDSTGTVWPERQRFLHTHGVRTRPADRTSVKPFGMNWKMSAKTILVQLHHKVGTFEHLSKKLVLVAQDHLLAYMRREFTFDHLVASRVGDPMHLHAYALEWDGDRYRLQLRERLSTDAAGIATCLGLQTEARVELEAITRSIEAKLSDRTLLRGASPPPAGSLRAEAEEDAGA